VTRRRKIILGGLAVFILAILIFLLLSFLQGKAPAGNNQPNQESTNAAGGNLKLNGAANNGTAANLTETGGKKINLEDNLKKIAINFTERYGSFSNQNQFQNIIDLESLMSEKMKTASEKLMAETKLQNTSVYSGTTTKAISAKLASLDEKAGVAEVIVSTQRFVATNSTANITKVYYQDMAIKFILIDKEWLVDGAIWK